MVRIMRNGGKIFLSGMLLCVFICGRVFAKPAENSVIKEVENFVQAFYDACSEGDIEKINGFYEEENMEREIKMRVGKECGIEEYNVLEMDVYPADDKQEVWLVIVSYELWVEGFEVGLPGISSILVDTAGDNWYLVDAVRNDPDLLEHVTSILEEGEVKDKILECDRKYQDILAENEGFGEWLMDVQDKMEEEIVLSLLEEEMDDTGDVAKEELRLMRYIVKKGDCLWRIAEKEMGNGIYWKELYEQNKESIGSNPNLILPGEELLIP